MQKFGSTVLAQQFDGNIEEEVILWQIKVYFVNTCMHVIEKL